MAGRTRLKWPAKLRHTDARDEWFKRFSKLKQGLSLIEVAKILGEPYASTYRWAHLFGYEFPDLRRRGRVSPEGWSAVDWTQRDAQIARDLNVSRERVRQVRAARGIGPSAHQVDVRRFSQWAKANRKNLHGASVAQAMESFGGTISPQVVRRLLRAADIKPFNPGSRWRNVDWRLPNRELARIWQTDPKYVANIRARLKPGPAKWSGYDRGLGTDGAYKKAVEAEQKAAKAARASA
jgi:hypothetical protein